MKHTIFFIIIFSFLFISNNSFSQDFYAVPFLSFPVSPFTTSMGATGSSLPSDDPYGFLLNPAQLGNISQTTNLSFAFYPGSSELWGLEGYNFNTLALNLGYNFNEKINFPVSIGLGYARTNYSIEYWGIQNDVYSTFSFGIGIDYGVQFNAGFSLKHISSTLKSTVSEIQDGSASKNAFDFGLLLNVPILKTNDPDFEINLFDDNPLYPTLNFSLGYSQLNIGDEIYYIDPEQADPLPRQARLGYGLALGFNLQLEQRTIKALGLDFTVDAQDILIERELFVAPDGDSTVVLASTDYQSFLGDIDIAKNIFMIEGSKDVAAKVGVGIELFEILTFRTGNINGANYDDLKTYGLELKSDGFLKLIASDEDPDLGFIADHFGLRFSYSNYYVAKGMDTDYFGISLFVKNFNSIF